MKLTEHLRAENELLKQIAENIAQLDKMIPTASTNWKPRWLLRRMRWRACGMAVRTWQTTQSYVEIATTAATPKRWPNAATKHSQRSTK